MTLSPDVPLALAMDVIRVTDALLQKEGYKTVTSGRLVYDIVVEMDCLEDKSRRYGISFERSLKDIAEGIVNVAHRAYVDRLSLDGRDGDFFDDPWVLGFYEVAMKRLVEAGASVEFYSTTGKRLAGQTEAPAGGVPEPS